MVVDALVVVDLAPAPGEAPGAVAGVGVDPVLHHGYSIITPDIVLLHRM